MKNFLCYFLVICTLFLNGCFNYNDIDQVIFATACIVDVDSQGNPIIYIEAFRPQKSSAGSAGGEERILFRGSRKTMFETLRDINLSSNYKLNFTQNMGIFFTEKAAAQDMKDFIDFFERDQEFVIRSNIAIIKGCADTFINVKLKGQEFIGVFIHDLIKNIPSSSREVMTSLNDFLDSMNSDCRTSVIPMLEIKQEQPENKIEIGDGAIITNYKMVDTLRRTDVLGYNFLLNNIKGSSLEVTNPDIPSKFIGLEIIKNNTKTRMYYSGKKLTVQKIINVKVSISEAQNKLNLDENTVKKIQANAEKNIAYACNKIFQDYKEKDLDIFYLKDDFKRRYPRENSNNIFQKSQLHMDVHVSVEGSSTKTNFRY
ncbi:Ger(x)C family spore germination protein [Clostridium luticellarii]|uniref:Spore germination protein A3 n=1 Tax=Clostridium luticellarii TaxID=1691940 RepID=A0A2T0BM92_9CLOT|nr:Ger(x)C family spore germination protein [Clostridium luticellarii]PRR84991.1 Spore germination protein A3 precursor [Clostridium luticellarii]